MIGLRRRIGSFVLAADFQLEPGERVALVGRSGIGKTSLLRCIAGLDSDEVSDEGGAIYLGSQEITDIPPQERGIGYIFQEQALFSSLNVLDNVTFGLRMRGVSRAERERLAMPWLERLGLEGHIHERVERLSGGESQRVAWIRALIWKPRLLLLDEPFSAMDRELRLSLQRELIALHPEWPVPLLFVTHDEADLQNFATTQLHWVEESSGVRRILRDES